MHFAEALLKLAADPALARRGQAGRQRHHDVFGLERMIAEYNRAFDQVLEATRDNGRGFWGRVPFMR